MHAVALAILATASAPGLRGMYNWTSVPTSCVDVCAKSDTLPDDPCASRPYIVLVKDCTDCMSAGGNFAQCLQCLNTSGWADSAAFYQNRLDRLCRGFTGSSGPAAGTGSSSTGKGTGTGTGTGTGASGTQPTKKSAAGGAAQVAGSLLLATALFVAAAAVL